MFFKNTMNWIDIVSVLPFYFGIVIAQSDDLQQVNQHNPTTYSTLKHYTGIYYLCETRVGQKYVLRFNLIMFTFFNNESNRLEGYEY